MLIPFQSTKISIEECVKQNAHVFIDVRSPGEFARGHIPGACNIPLFSDQVRAMVGCIYVQKGKQEAMRIAMQQVGPHLGELVEQVRAVFDGRSLCVYCARGGMRSAAVCGLFQFFQLPAVQLSGGYKSFRNWVLDQFLIERDMRILAGFTGSGKTALLHAWAAQGRQMIDLELLAGHKGSVLGGDKRMQTTQQQFENGLAWALNRLRQGPVWLEDESRKIGGVIIPEGIWRQMQQAPICCLDVPREQRLARVMAEYGSLDDEFIRDALQQIKEQLGGARYQELMALLEEGDRLRGADILLAYYDAKYGHGLTQKKGRLRATLD